MGRIIHNRAIFTTTFITRHVNIIFHGCGIYILSCIIRKRFQPQLYLIRNLSIFQVIRNLAPLPMMYANLCGSKVMTRVNPFVKLTFRAAFELNFYFIMIAITTDRLLLVLIPYRYRLNATPRNVKCTVYVTWVITVLLGVLLCALYTSGTIDRHLNPEIMYIRFTFDILFLGIACLAYGILFKSNKDRLARLFAVPVVRNRRQLLRDAKLHVYLVLISTYIIFIFTAHLMDMLLWRGRGHKPPGVWLNTRMLIYSVSDFSDGLAYILMHNEVRRRFCDMLQRVLPVKYINTNVYFEDASTDGGGSSKSSVREISAITGSGRKISVVTGARRNNTEQIVLTRFKQLHDT